MKNTAPKIRAFLVAREITQTQIAKDLGVSVTMINKWISGTSQSQRVYNYFIELGCPREYFVGRPETRKAA
ncbi:MAG: helix-turn-helix domain-containing protein [Desulfomicrobium sp.]